MSIPPVSYYIVYHNVTSNGDQGIITYDANVTINVTNDQFEANAVYSIQVAAVNVIGQGPVIETIFSECHICVRVSVSVSVSMCAKLKECILKTDFAVVQVFATN